MKPSVIIVAHDSIDFIGHCLRHLADQILSAEVVVVDNGSTDGTVDFVRSQFPHVKVVTQPNLGFGAGCNRGAREAQGDVLAFLNPDTEAQPGWLAALVDGLRPGRIHTSQIVDLDNPLRVQTLGLDLHYTGVATLRRTGEHAPIMGPPEEVPGFSGAAFAMMRSDFERLGGFDDGFFLYMEDVDFAWRARRQGMSIWGIPASIAAHRRAGRINKTKLDHLRRGRNRLLRKHLALRTRRRLAVAIALVEFAERIGARASRLRALPAVECDPLPSKPRWLRRTIPLRPLPMPGKLYAFAVNPLLALLSMRW